MELKQIKDLMAAMGKTGIKRVKIKKEDYEVELEREGPVEYRQVNDLPVSVPTSQPRTGDIPPATHPPYENEPVKTELEGTFVTSPMVGTFFATPSPEEPPFVKVGDKMEPNTVVCIIEAMKVMNEIKAGVSGTVTEVLAENGHPVEFGSKLFKVT